MRVAEEPAVLQQERRQMLQLLQEGGFRDGRWQPQEEQCHKPDVQETESVLQHRR
jgi:hypothetical protein